MTMKKLLIVAAAFAALSAPALAQSMTVDGSRSLHSAPDYAGIEAGNYGPQISLKLLEAEMLYDQYND
jgi:polyisoprenoid-binding protein YceI